MTKETKEIPKQSLSENKTQRQGVSIAGVVLGVIALVVIIFIASAPLIRDSLETTKESTGSSRSSSMESGKATQSWKDLSMAERKDIYLRVTDFDPGPEADRVTAEMIQKYNISKDDVTAILLKGTFEWGWGDIP